MRMRKRRVIQGGGGEREREREREREKEGWWTEFIQSKVVNKADAGRDREE
jgi:hypothetical protein